MTGRLSWLSEHEFVAPPPFRIFGRLRGFRIPITSDPSERVRAPAGPGEFFWVAALDGKSHIRRGGVQPGITVKPPPKRIHASIVAIINALQFVEAEAIVTALERRFGGFQTLKIRGGKHANGTG